MKDLFIITLLIFTFSETLWGKTNLLKTTSFSLHQSSSLFKNIKMKNGPLIAVIDTGISLKNTALHKNIFFPAKSIPFSRNSQDNNGHGTHVSSIISSLNPASKMIPLKYYESDSSSSQETTKASLLALKYAILNNIPIINYSGGGPGSIPQERELFEEAQRKDIIIILAAGNNGKDIDEALERKKNEDSFFPANYNFSNFIVVAATDEEGQNLMPESNYGKKSVFIAAPGKNIEGKNQFGQNIEMTGTSQATAVVTALVSIIKTINPHWGGQQIKKAISACSIKKKSLEGKVFTSSVVDFDKTIKWSIENGLKNM